MRPIKSAPGTQTTIAAVLLAMTAASAAQAQTAADTDSVTPMSAVDPFGKTVDPFGNPLDPFGKTIDPFGGNVDPFGGNVDPFGRTVDPFGNPVDPFGNPVDPFRGTVDPFAGSTSGLSSQKMGQFWGSFETSWTQTSQKWVRLSASPADAVAQSDFMNSMNALINQSEGFWGQIVRQKTGKNVREAFVDGLLAKYGVSLANPASFAQLTPNQRSRLVYEWYDGLNTYAGIDHVDHWMRAVRWNPKISVIQGEGADSTIGIIDGNVGTDRDLTSKIVSSSGSSSSVGGHGAAVLSLIVADHDGRGVQGIAPKARVIAYNPFDSSNKASWDSVKRGIHALKAANASIINLSLGERGFTFSPRWSSIFNDPTVKTYANSTVYVIAAGNDGLTQMQKVTLPQTGRPSIIIVGSVDPNDQISSFSNRPGTACFTQSSSGSCTTNWRLMDRFIVAPGELLLASNGNGGLTRVSGTSFSAPLVSGAITLLHDRWPWLTNHPAETTDIVLRSARDLGAPGVDAVYGRGMLDVEASQSPLNFNNLTYVRYKGSETTGTSISTTDARAGSVPLTFETDGMFYYAIETIGNTRRDFAIPLSTRLIGTKTSVSGTSEYFQSYVAARMNDWIKANRPAIATSTFSDVETAVERISADWTFGLTMSAPQYAQGPAMRLVNLPKPVATLAHPEGRYGFSVGLGEGVRTLGGQRGFGLSSDYDPANGGVNPMLGYASGGAFASVDLALNAKTTLSLGFTEGSTPVAETLTLTDGDRRRFSGLRDYKAGAGTLRLTHRPSSNVSLTVDYARINESNGIFGVRSLEDSDFAKGATTETATFGADMRLPGNMSIAGSATLGLTRAKKRANQAFALADSGALSSAFAISVDKQGILGKRDKLRLSASQPLTIESGAFDFTSVGITDRTTGELGEITQRFNIKSRTRRFAGEAIYATPLTDAGELSLFGRVDLGQQENGKVDGILIGGRLSLRF